MRLKRETALNYLTTKGLDEEERENKQRTPGD